MKMRIKYLRKKSGYSSQGQLARIMGTSRATIAKWEIGITKPSVEKLPKLAQALNCTIEELYEVEETK